MRLRRAFVRAFAGALALAALAGGASAQAQPSAGAGAGAGAGVGAEAVRPACTAALVEGLATPRVVAQGELLEVTLRRSLQATPRADAALLKDALRKSLTREARTLQLRNVSYGVPFECDRYRIVSLSVRRDDVRFVDTAAAPAMPQDGPEESTERLVELWQAREANTQQLRTLQLRFHMNGERALAQQVLEDISALIRGRALPPMQVTP